MIAAVGRVAAVCGGRRLALWLAIWIAAVPAVGRSQGVRFEDVTEAAGLSGPLAGILGHGAAWGDVDGDGWIDLFVGGFCDRPNDAYHPAARPVPSKLLRNSGTGSFAPIESTPANHYARTSGAVFADLDNDAFLELYVANNVRARGPNCPQPQRGSSRRHSMLLRNRGGRLVDVSKQSGACPDELESVRNVGVLDFNHDGLLDLFVVEDRFTHSSRSILFRNAGGLKFVDANREAGLPDDVFGLGLAVADVNEDGRPDLFVGHSNRFFLSTPGGKYREPPSLRETFAWEPLHNEDWPCGAAFGDLNRDGRLDLVLAIHGQPARNRVYLNEGLHGGVPRFRDVTAEVGLPGSLPVRTPHVEIQDFDNDGWPDLYFSVARVDARGNATPAIYRHAGLRGGLPRFEPPADHGRLVYYPAGPSGDYDRDGRLDLFLTNWFRTDRCRLLRNVSTPRHWLDVEVVGRTVNRMGIGARVWVYRSGRLGQDAGLIAMQEIATGYGYASGQPAVAHFGLGDAGRVDVRVRLPGGKVLQQEDVEADRRLVLEE